MLSEVGYVASGAVAGVGGVAIMFRFLNAKIDKKQDKTLCETIAKNFGKAIDKSDKNHEKVMEILGEIQVSNGKIEQELKHMNGKT
ncbi:MAG: hypothetical protein KAS32_14020 [Candidatus Peribacteraceae bacterium]|nr:hypothetical protein [Candidatus Peribacteraceae bacterium]